MQNARQVYRLSTLGIAAGAFFGIVCFQSSGCARLAQGNKTQWHDDYQRALGMAHQSDRELLFCFFDDRRNTDQRLQAVVKSESVKTALRDFVVCRLFRSHEPDRRFAAQFNVDRAPALILFHRDGTYHAQTSLHSSRDVLDFLRGSSPPGDQPRVDPYVPYRTVYNWQDSLADPEGESNPSPKPRFVVLYRTFSNDWGKLSGILQRREVYSRLAHMIHCRISSRSNDFDLACRRYDVREFPAVVIEHGEDFDVLEMPTGYESMVRFADRFMRHTNATVALKPGQ